jgi:CHAD domain-containing protein
MSDPPHAGSYVAARLRALDDRLREAAPRVLSSAQSQDAVHDLRVALRRTRTVLEVSRELFGRFQSDEVRCALREVQRATGALRDEEVLFETIESVKMVDPGVSAWLKSRRARERRFRRALARRIEAGELDRGRRLLDALLAFRVDPSRDKRLAKFARRAVGDARRRVERHRSPRTDDPLALHRLRIAYKRLRYVVETFAEVLPSDVTALAQGAARLQNRLGRVHDVDMAVGSVQRARALPHESRKELLSALERMRAERLASYSREQAPLAYAGGARAEDAHAPGVEALRKISTR